MPSQSEEVSPSQFYSGLVAELYDALAGEVAEADRYARFLDHSGTPALELACGSGTPMLDLLERGYDVTGLDSSTDMLDLFRRRAAERGLEPQLHHGLMQSFRLPGRFRSIFLAGASFTLLTSDADASAALTNIYDHLEEGGHALIPIEQVDLVEVRRVLHRYREKTDASGARMRVAVVACEPGGDDQSALLRIRYERIPQHGEAVAVERTWARRWWSRAQFGDLVHGAGFADVSFLDPDGAPIDSDPGVFVAVARRGGRRA